MGKRGPAPKPTSVRQAGRRTILPREPQPPSARPPTPRWLTPVARKEWRRVVPVLDQLGLLTKLDMAALAGYCKHYAEWVDFQEKIERFGPVIVVNEKVTVVGETIVKSGGTPTRSPYINLAHDAFDRMLKCAVQFGFTPSSRRGIEAPALPERPRATFQEPEGGDPRKILKLNA